MARWYNGKKTQYVETKELDFQKNPTLEYCQGILFIQ